MGMANWRLHRWRGRQARPDTGEHACRHRRREGDLEGGWLAYTVSCRTFGSSPAEVGDDRKPRHSRREFLKRKVVSILAASAASSGRFASIKIQSRWNETHSGGRAV